MVEQQIMARGITDTRVLDAFRKVVRHEFVPGETVGAAYEDHPVSIGCGQTISQPYIVALMTEALELKGSEKILELGTGCGYQTAILAELSGEVYSIERHDTLAQKACRILEKMGYTNIHIKTGDGTEGWLEHAPFDRVIVTAASPAIPEPLIEQLSDRGKLVIPLGPEFSQTLTLIEKSKNTLKTRHLCACTFVPLIGRYGWHDRTAHNNPS